MTARVLLVEDSPMISSGLKALLESAGFDVTVATTATEAAAWGGMTGPSVMLLDINLPDGDGLTVIGALAARGLKPLTTYAMTGHTDSTTRARCIAAGCEDVLLKPVPVRQLLRIVSEAVA
ncbi:MAG TPA: response regulator [Gemmatimonadaceae bacterium]|nr:response regulator [Gemmatimonadaceae bacterium]